MDKNRLVRERSGGERRGLGGDAGLGGWIAKAVKALRDGECGMWHVACSISGHLLCYTVL